MEGGTKSFDSIIRDVFYLLFVICSFVLSILALPFLLPISLVFRMYRHTQFGMIRDKYPDAMMVSGDDSLWLQDSTENPAVINALVHLDGKCNIEQFQKMMFDRIVKAKDETGQLIYPKLQRYATKFMNQFVWMKEDNFDIKDHVFLFNGRLPNNMQEIHKVTNNAISTPLPKCKSMWQFMIIPYRENDSDTFLMLSRIHHSIVDGISLVQMVVSNMVDKKPAESSSKRFGAKNKLVNALKAIFLGPALLIAKVFWLGDSNILHGPKPSGKKIVSWSSPIELNLVKKIKNSTGSTVNDVLVSCLGGAFNKYFRDSGADIPENLSLYVPVDVRSPKSRPTLDNQLGLVFLSLPTAIEDSLARLRETKRRMDYIKSTPEPIVMALLIKYVMNSFPNWLTKMVSAWLTNKGTATMSNVPGPEEQLFLGGHPISGLIFWAPQRNDITVGVSILSYNGHVRIGVMVDKVVSENPDLILEAFIDEVKQLAAEIKVE